MYEMPYEVQSVFSWFMVFMILTMVLSIVNSVFMGLAVYNDAMFKRSKSAVMWGVLSGLFGWIPAVIYLVAQSSESKKPRQCERCFAYLAPGAPHCYYCGHPVYMPPPELMERYDRRRKLFLGLWIGSIALAIVLSVVMMVWFFNGMINLSEWDVQYY